MPTPTTTFRLRPRTRRVLERLASEQNKSQRELLELAIAHLDGTLRNGQPVYLDIPPDPAVRHKRVASGG